jgi:hypothetical protein
MFDQKIALQVLELQKQIDQVNDLLEELHEQGLTVAIDLEKTEDGKSAAILLQSVVEYNVYL